MLRRFPNTTRRRIYLAPTYVEALVAGFGRRRLFSGVATYCMFIGYPRSGHSLVGSLLDAHPDAVIAHELDALGFVRAGFRRNQLYALILANSRSIAAQGRTQTGYDYVVPGGAQGRFESLRVIGDKRGRTSMARLQRHPELLRRLLSVVRDPVRFVHVVRNPYDNITTMAKRRNVPLGESLENYFGLCRAVAAVKDQVPAETVIDVRHENLVRDPKGTVKDLCNFLGLVPSDEYIEACASIVFSSPHRSRLEGDWTPELRGRVEEGMASFPFLEGYSWDD
jgi:hypothetical protein